MMSLKATGYYIIVKPDVTEEKTESGIILAHETVEANKHATIHGEIVSVGPTAWAGFGDGQPWASVGQRVVFARYAGKRITDEQDTETEYVIMCDNDIIAIQE